MPRPLAPLLTLLACVLSLAAAQTSATETLNVGGVEREYYLHVPAEAEAPYLLVLVLHGRGGDGPGMARLSAFDAVADAHGFIAVYPSGLNQEWNYLEGVPGYDLAGDDVTFFRALIEHLAGRYPVDPARIYAAGFSNGGFMAQRLICDASDLFAAYAAVGAAGFGGLPLVCNDPHPLSLLLMHGTLDRIVPFEGLTQDTPGGKVVILVSVVDTLAFWAGYGGCDSEGRSFALPQRGRSPGTDVRALALEHCPEGNELIVYIVRGGGHNWPGQAGKIREEVGGAVNLDIDAGEVIWTFFARHPKPGP